MKAKLDHINLTVGNLTESMEWYKNAFDFEYLEGNIHHEDEPWAIIGKDDFMICMYEKKSLTSAAEQPDSPFHRIYHFGVRISDRNHWEERIKQHHFNVQYGGAYQYKHSVSWYVLDPSGHEIEVSFAENAPLKF